MKVEVFPANKMDVSRRVHSTKTITLTSRLVDTECIQGQWHPEFILYPQSFLFPEHLF